MPHPRSSLARRGHGMPCPYNSTYKDAKNCNIRLKPPMNADTDFDFSIGVYLRFPLLFFASFAPLYVLNVGAVRERPAVAAHGSRALR